MEELRLSKMTFTLMEDGLIKCVYHKDAVVFLHDIQEVIAKGKEIFNDKKKYFLVYFDGLKGISDFAQHFFASQNGSQNVGGIAFVIGNEESREKIIEFLSENNPQFPAAVFDKESPATDWLKHVKLINKLMA